MTERRASAETDDCEREGSDQTKEHALHQTGRLSA
jgi:hypothetical protein